MTLVAVKVMLLVLLALILQQSVLDDLRVGGVQPDVMLLVAVAAGMAGRAERGAVVGFVAGLLADLFSPVPLGLAALTFSVVGYVVGSIQAGIIRSVWWIPVLTAFVASALGVVLYAVVAAMIGRPHYVSLHLLFTAGGVALVNAVLAGPAVAALRWGLGAPSEAYAR